MAIIVVNTRSVNASRAVLLLSRSLSTPASTTSSTPTVVKPRGIEAVIKYGPGGRSSVSGVAATVFGSTGFVGRYVVNRLGKIGSLIMLPYRGDEHDWRHLKPMGDLGQINATYYSPRDPAAIAKLVSKSNVVINLIGRDYETRNFSFYDVNVTIPSLIAKAAKEAGVSRFIHVSALGAAEDSPSRFLQTKWQGEQEVRAAFPEATIIRPASIFGHEDRFLHRLGWLHSLVLVYGDPLVNEGKTRHLPVYVGDVAEGIVRAMKESETAGKTFEFIGPKEYTYEEILTIFSEISKRPINPINYPPRLYKLIAAALSKFPPSPKISPEDVVRLGLDEKTTGLLGLKSLGIEPSTLETHALAQLRRYRTFVYYDEPANVPNALPKQNW